jgi:hypothetical protein
VIREVSGYTQVSDETAAKVRVLLRRMEGERMGAWPDNATFPVGYDERDAKGV